MNAIHNLKLTAIVIVLAAFGHVPMAGAATEAANLSVSASVAASCTISTAPLAFGSYDPVTTHATTPLDGTGTVTITCTDGASVTVSLDLGLNEGAGTQRKLLSGTETIDYDLFSNAGRSTAWNETTTVARTGTGLADALTVYGRIPAGQTNASSGSYADTVVATVNF